MSTLREEILALAAEKLNREFERGLQPLPDILRDIHAHAAEALMAGPQELARFAFFLGQVQALRDSLMTDNTQAVEAEGAPHVDR